MVDTVIRNYGTANILQPPSAVLLSLDHGKLELGEDNVCDAVLVLRGEHLCGEDRLKKQFSHD